MKLIITEKPTAAKRIAQILGKSEKLKILKKGKFSYYELDDSLIFPLIGHVENLDFPEQYNNWQSTDLDDLIKADLIYEPSFPGLTKNLQSFAPNYDQLIIATDYDREGESIGKEAITIVKKENPTITIKRAKFSALTSDEIKKAFSNLTSFDDNLADSADARREIDLIWGAVLTRYVSLTSHRLGHSFLSVGRVQTPTLGIVVSRQKEILKFKPKPYWTVTIFCEKDGKKFEAIYEEEKLFDKEKADQIAATKTDKAVVKDIEKKRVHAKPPHPFNTTEFLRAASSIGFQPRSAMGVAEYLYISGHISYPRTDNTQYLESTDIRGLVEKFAKSEEFGELAKKILTQKTITPTKGKKKTTDHPPIHPVEAVSKQKLKDREWRIYELIVRRFLATLAKTAEIETIKAELDYNSNTFIARGKTIIKPGWREYYIYSKVEEVILPELEKGETINIEDLTNEGKQTKPKPHYTPSALIKKMDENNLGTKSTRAEILQKLIDRGYIQGRKSFIPSHIAFSVIDTLEHYAKNITKPTMTSKLEQEMDLVENGSKTKTEVVEQSRKMLKEILDDLEKNKEDVSKRLVTALREDKVMGTCPLCKGDLVIIRSRRTGKQFVGCSNYSKGCRESYPLPQHAKIVAMKELCEECGTPIIQVIRKMRRPFKMCLSTKCSTKADWGKKKKTKKTTKKVKTVKKTKSAKKVTKKPKKVSTDSQA